jgi:N-acetylglucosaminyldiphosphoundecaprenol N-acetyl-beta-D-mannosaminyltransferase
MSFSKLMGFNISMGSKTEILKEIVSEINLKKFGYACVANVHMFVEAQKKPHFMDIVNNAKFVLPDGMPLTKALDWLLQIKQERITGMEIIDDLLKEAIVNNFSVFFYGSTQSVINSTLEKCRNIYPELKIGGYICPPFRELSEVELTEDIEIINNSGSRLIFIALGCPKQEIWMNNNYKKINGTLIGIGGALPVFANLQKRAPEWMQKSSLEWLYRLIQEPKRLFKRYLFTNSLFINFIFREKLKTLR